MSEKNRFGPFALLIVTLVLTGCLTQFGEWPADSGVDGDANMDGNADSDGDIDADVDDEVDRDGDEDGVSDGNADTDLDGDTDTDATCGDSVVHLPEECEAPDTRPCTTTCGTAGTFSCIDCRWAPQCLPPPDVCNLIDDDCNLETPDGVHDPLLGEICDGSDDDSCDEGIMECVEGELICSDSTGPNPELCNGRDDDCDGLTLNEGSGEDWYLAPCDGPDSDSCMEGELFCFSARPFCTDFTSDSVELCNGEDDDCDDEIPFIENDTDGDGFRICEGDCDDENSDVNPRADEECNGFDDDCDDLCDEAWECCAEDTEPCETSCGTTGVILCQDDCSWGECESPFEVCNDTDDDCDGFVDEANEIPISSTYIAASWGGLDSAQNEFGYGVVWSASEPRSQQLHFISISSDGSRIGEEIQFSDTDGTSHAPNIVWTGSQYGIAWNEFQIRGSNEVYFAILSEDGEKLIDNLRLTNATDFGGRASLNHEGLVWTGSEYGVVWHDTRDGGDNEVYFTRVSPDGVELTDNIRVTNAPGNSGGNMGFGFVWTGTTYAIVWADRRPGDTGNLYLALVSEDGDSVEEIRLTDEGVGEAGPRIAWTGSEFGVVWRDSRNGEHDVLFLRVSEEGVPIGEEVLVEEIEDGSYPIEIVWTGHEYGVLIAAAEIGDLYIVQLAEHGSVDVPGTEFMYPVDRPSFAGLHWRSEEFTVVWSGRKSDWVRAENYFVRLSCYP